MNEKWMERYSGNVLVILKDANGQKKEHTAQKLKFPIKVLQ